MQYPKLSGWLAERRAVSKRADIKLTNVTKFVSSGKRVIRGLASSISVDRQGDIVVPGGGTWKLPAPLLWQHSHKDPVGWVTSIEVRGDGLWIEAEFAEGFERADEVWRMVEAGLIGSFSIGFRAIKSEPLPGGGLRFVRWELLEISVVVVPANPDAKISRGSVKLTQEPRLPKGAVRITTTKEPPLPPGCVRISTLPKGAVRVPGLAALKRVPKSIPGHRGAVPIKTRGGR